VQSGKSDILQKHIDTIFSNKELSKSNNPARNAPASACNEFEIIHLLVQLTNKLKTVSTQANGSSGNSTDLYLACIQIESLLKH
jgi:hypothetical protein